MPQATILDSVIKVTLKGYEAAKKQLAAMAVDVKKLNSSLSTIGNASAKGFTLATGGIMGFLKAADPVRFMVFTQKLEILSIYIGLTFIPILDDAIVCINKLINIFANLSDEQREQILHWTKVGLAIMAAGTALAAILGGISKAIPLIQALGVAIRLLMGSTGIGLVVALAAAAFAIYELLKATGKLDPFIERITKLFEKFMVTALEPLMPVLDILATVFVEAINEILPAVTELATTFVDMVKQILPVLTEFAITGGKLIAQLGKEYANFIKDVAPQFMEFGKNIATILILLAKNFIMLLPALVQLAAAFQKIYMIYYATLAKVFLALMEAITAVFPSLIEVINKLVPVFVELANAAAELAPMIAEIIGLIVKMGGDALAQLIKAAAELFTVLWKAFGPGMIDGIRLVVQVAKQCLEMIARIVEKAKELVDIANQLNPFSDSEPSRSDSGKGDNSKERSSDGGTQGDRDWGPRWTRIGGKKEKEIDWVKVAQSAVKGATGNNEKNNKFAPMAGMGKVEIMGVEEAFKRAQTAAGYDPSKMADLERKKLQQQSNATLREIADNTAREPAAAKVR